MRSYMHALKKIKAYVGSVILFSFILQSASPLIAATRAANDASRRVSIQAPEKQNSIFDNNLNKLVVDMVEDALEAGVGENLSEPLKRCYQRVVQGKRALPMEDVWQAMPEILKYAVEQQQTKAVRPDAPKASVSNPVVGPGACDLAQVLDLLIAVRNRIGSASDEVCCKTILGILGDACEKFGPDSNISCKLLEICEKLSDICPTFTCDLEPVLEAIEECCEELQEDIFDTRTIICDKFNGTFTVLEEIQETLEECCESIQEGIDELSEQLEECCEELQEDIFDTRTIICDKFNGTFTVLQEIKEQLEECCESIQESINDLSEQLEECCEELQEDIFDTRTIICKKLEGLCLPTSLTQEDVVAGAITLTEPGNYKFCADIEADLFISNTGIAVDMNDRKLVGTVCIRGDDVVLENGYIQPEAPTTLAEANVPAVAVKDCVLNARLLNLTITNADSVGVDANNNGLPGRAGIDNNGMKTFILDCCIQTGAGFAGGDADDSPLLAAGNGGEGGCGIISHKDKAQIGRTIVMTGNGGNGGSSVFGTPAIAAAGAGGASGAGIKIFGNLSCIFDCKVFTGVGGDGGTSCCMTGGNGGDSGAGICNSSQSTEIKESTARTGNAGAGGMGDTDSNGGNGGNSGHALKTQGTQITAVVLSTGNGGNGGNAGTGGAGGNAGYGLFVLDACDTEAREIVVERTGFGGNGGNSAATLAPGGAGGSGGDAVHITQGSKHTEVRSSTFSNTGRGGLGGSGGPMGGLPGAAGAPGRAVTDLNTDLCSLDPACVTDMAPSAIFSNFAYGIGDTSIRYLLNGKVQEAGRSSDKSCNRLDNVYVECNVDVVFDICQELVDTRTALDACCQELQEGINDLGEQLAECCDTIQEGIGELSEQLEACCEELQEDIFDTQTILCDKFNQTFTVLDSIQESLEECCSNVQEDINDLSEQLGECCDTIQENIDSLSEQLEECCQKLQEDVFDTRTIICDKFNQTFTVLDGIQESIHECCSNIQEDINDLSEQLGECCESIREDIFDTQTILANKIDNLEIVVTLTGNPCDSIPVSQPGTIIQPGVYCLTESINGTIFIAADNVTLDLNGHVINASSPGVSATGQTGLTIKNGTVMNADNGIELIDCSRIMLRNLNLVNNFTGIFLSNVSRGLIKKCAMEFNSIGMLLNQSSLLRVENCASEKNDNAGFSLQASSNNTFKKCIASKNGTAGQESAFGFVTRDGRSNVFEECNAQATITNATDDVFLSAGFAITGTEMCTKIINCESFDNTSNSTGLAIPYGILLEKTFEGLEQADAQINGALVNSVNWSPNGQYFAIGGQPTINGDISLYKISKNINNFILQDIQAHGNSVFSINWSPDGNYLAIGGATGTGGFQIRVYKFNQNAGTLTLLPGSNQVHGAIVNSVNWSPNGNYLAIGGLTGTGGFQVRVYKFDQNAETLTLLPGSNQVHGGTVFSVNWSPDSNYLAIGGAAGTLGFQIRVYEFDPNSGTLNALLGSNQIHGNPIQSVNWSPNNKYLGVGGVIGTGGFQIRVYEFSTSTETLTVLPGSNQIHGNIVFSVNWSPDGKYFAIGGFPGTGGFEIRIYEFDANNQSLVLVDSQIHGNAVQSVNWSPDGTLFGIGGDAGTGGFQIRAYDAFVFPTKNIIKNNIVYCNEGNECPSGVGISGSSLCNLIIGNTSYQNIFNYQFVTNVFNGGINGTPSLLENVSIPPL